MAEQKSLDDLMHGIEYSLGQIDTEIGVLLRQMKALRAMKPDEHGFGGDLAVLSENQLRDLEVKAGQFKKDLHQFIFGELESLIENAKRIYDDLIDRVDRRVRDISDAAQDAEEEGMGAARRAVRKAMTSF